MYAILTLFSKLARADSPKIPPFHCNLLYLAGRTNCELTSLRPQSPSELVCATPDFLMCAGSTGGACRMLARLMPTGAPLFAGDVMTSLRAKHTFCGNRRSARLCATKFSLWSSGLDLEWIQGPNRLIPRHQIKRFQDAHPVVISSQLQWGASSPSHPRPDPRLFRI